MNKKYMLYFDKRIKEQLEWLADQDNRTGSGKVSWLIQQEVKRRAQQFPTLGHKEQDKEAVNE